MFLRVICILCHGFFFFVFLPMLLFTALQMLPFTLCWFSHTSPLSFICLSYSSLCQFFHPSFFLLPFVFLTSSIRLAHLYLALHQCIFSSFSHFTTASIRISLCFFFYFLTGYTLPCLFISFSHKTLLLFVLLALNQCVFRLSYFWQRQQKWGGERVKRKSSRVEDCVAEGVEKRMRALEVVVERKEDWIYLKCSFFHCFFSSFSHLNNASFRFYHTSPLHLFAFLMLLFDFRTPHQDLCPSDQADFSPLYRCLHIYSVLVSKRGLKTRVF